MRPKTTTRFIHNKGESVRNVKLIFRKCNAKKEMSKKTFSIKVYFVKLFGGWLKRCKVLSLLYYKNFVCLAEAEYSHFSAHFRLKIFLLIFLDYMAFLFSNVFGV